MVMVGKFAANPVSLQFSENPLLKPLTKNTPHFSSIGISLSQKSSFLRSLVFQFSSFSPCRSLMPPWRKKSSSTNNIVVTRPFLPCIATALLFSFFLFFLFHLTSSPTEIPSPQSCHLSIGKWVRRQRRPFYNNTCPFHRNAWNCLRNGRDGMDAVNSWVWIPEGCGSEVGIDPVDFLSRMRGKRIGFVGDSLNENFVVAFLCVLRSADGEARKWKRKGAWRGGYFPRFDVTVAYHRTVLLAKYEWQPVNQSNLVGGKGVKGIYKVDVDIPANDWANITTFYDVLVFNTGHWWGSDKFPKETPLVFFRNGKPIMPPLGILDGFEVVLGSMVQYIEREVPRKTIKFWRTQSPRHFYGGEWNQNGSCVFKEPLEKHQLDAWFDPANNGVNKEARLLNELILNSLRGTDIQLLNLTHLSEFRADAHPAIWLGKKDAVAVWGQDCLHWCLPGLPDTWVDILSAQIINRLEKG